MQFRANPPTTDALMRFPDLRPFVRFTAAVPLVRLISGRWPIG